MDAIVTLTLLDHSQMAQHTHFLPPVRVFVDAIVTLTHLDCPQMAQYTHSLSPVRVTMDATVTLTSLDRLRMAQYTHSLPPVGVSVDAIVTVTFSLLLPGSISDLTALNQQRKFRDKGNTKLGWQLLQQSGLGELQETKARRGTDMVIIMYNILLVSTGLVCEIIYSSYPCNYSSVNMALTLFNGLPYSMHVCTHTL